MPYTHGFQPSPFQAEIYICLVYIAHKDVPFALIGRSYDTTSNLLFVHRPVLR